jgi:hypothetical protein
MTYKVVDLHKFYLKCRSNYIASYKTDISFNDYLLEFACEMNNNKIHKTIKGIPFQVFDGLDTNKQKINYVYYPLYKKGTIVIKRPETKGAFS